MKNIIPKSIIQFVKFGIVGCSNVFISYLVYTICIYIGTGYLIANTMGYFLSVCNAFFWNNRYVFRKKQCEKRTLWKVFIKSLLTYAGTGLVLNNLLLVLWIDYLHIPEIVGPAINIMINLPINFLLQKYWAFRKEKTIEKEDK